MLEWDMRHDQTNELTDTFDEGGLFHFGKDGNIKYGKIKSIKQELQKPYRDMKKQGLSVMKINLLHL
jgi:hypothetical protein